MPPADGASRIGRLMAAIRTTAAAAMLGVSASTLRSWERRYGFPVPQRTDGGHRQYALEEVEALRGALGRTSDASAAVAIARRGGGAAQASPHDALRRALVRFDEDAADRVVEESMQLRSLERTVDEVLLPAVEALEDEGAGSAEAHHAHRWARRWLAVAQRHAPPAHRDRTVLVLDGTAPGGADALHVEALELALRRTGVRVLTVAAEIAAPQLQRALRKVVPHALVLSGRAVGLDRLGRLVFAAQRAAGGELAVVDFRGPLDTRRSTGVERLDGSALVARSRLMQLLDESAAPPMRIRRTR